MKKYRIRKGSIADFIVNGEIKIMDVSIRWWELICESLFIGVMFLIVYLSIYSICVKLGLSTK